MQNSVKLFGAAIALLVALSACTGLPAAPTAAPAATAAPSGTEVPGSTEAAPTAGPTNAAETPGGAATAPPTATPDATQVAAPTTAPEPTMPPAPTEAPSATAGAIACAAGALTPAQTEGPYYKENPPESESLLQPGMAGTKLTLTGYVLDDQCRPVPGARVDFWQADAAGEYDNQGYTLRGYQTTDASGRYVVETVLPGLYPGRTRHIHVKITPSSGPTLTTQLYFPDEAANTADRIFSPELLVSLEKRGGRRDRGF